MTARDHGGQGQPVPIIDPTRCDGCGLCVRVCPSGALALQGGQAVVARPGACAYTGLCEMACPTAAIQRPFEIVLRDTTAKPTKVKENAAQE